MTFSNSAPNDALPKALSKLQRHARMLACAAAAFGTGQGLTHLVAWPWVYWAVSLPGTFLHESAHWIFALMMGGDPAGFSIFPTHQEGAMQSLGHVGFHPTWYNAATVALSPLLLGFIGAYLVTLASTLRWRMLVPFGYVAACCFASMFPSRADWSIAALRPLSFFPMVLILGACSYGLWQAVVRRWR